MMCGGVMGKGCLIELEDCKGGIEVYITGDDMCGDEKKDLYNIVLKGLVDLGDFVGMEGFVLGREMGEMCMDGEKVRVLWK